jgi:hypothetical protein
MLGLRRVWIFIGMKLFFFFIIIFFILINYIIKNNYRFNINLDLVIIFNFNSKYSIFINELKKINIPILTFDSDVKKKINILSIFNLFNFKFF